MRECREAKVGSLVVGKGRRQLGTQAAGGEAEAEVDGGIMTTHRYLSLEIIYFLVRTAFNYEGKLTD